MPELASRPTHGERRFRTAGNMAQTFHFHAAGPAGFLRPLASVPGPMVVMHVSQVASNEPVPCFLSGCQRSLRARTHRSARNESWTQPNVGEVKWAAWLASAGMVKLGKASRYDFFGNGDSAGQPRAVAESEANAKGGETCSLV